MKYKRIRTGAKDACSGCRVCEMVCSLFHDMGSINPQNSMIRINYDNEKGLFTPVTCHNCKKADCIVSCPEGAIYRDIETSSIVINEKLCSGCKICMDVCPHHAINFHKEKKVALICDSCAGDPKCVKYCLLQAICYK